MSKRYPGGIIRKTPQTPSQTSAQGIWDMASVTQAVKENTWPIAGVPDPISKSLRFRQSASAFLTRTVAGINTTQLTFSFWVKYGVNANDNVIYATSNNSSNYLYIGFNSSFALDVQIGATANRRITTQVFRDPSAWYHIVVTFDTTQATASDRIKIYVNGSQVTAFSTNTTGVSQNANLPSISSTLTNYIGNYNGSAGFYFDGYMTELYAVYGQALTPSSFGNTNDQTGVWQPIAYTGTYGTNGFYLPFSNTASTTTLGYDFSGNSNNWTTNNISLTSGSTYDSMVDVPTQWIPYNTAGDTGALWRGNYAVLNPLNIDPANPTGTITNGNLNVSNTTSQALAFSTIGFITGKYYFEYVLTTLPSTATSFTGVCTSPYAATNLRAYRYDTGQYFNGSAWVSYGATWTTNDVIGVAIDMTNQTIEFFKNGTSQGQQTSIGLTGLTIFPILYMNGNNAASNINFGQRPFSYTPPAGFKTLCTTNLSTPTIGATASTVANKYFDVNIWTGNGSTQSITNSGSMQPDLVWYKSRSNSGYDHYLEDSVRGTNKWLGSSSTSAELTVANSLTSFNSNGFTLGSDAGGNQNTLTYVGWQWRASNTTAVTNTAGSITSTVSANTTAGFSIVTYTGNATNGATVGHGLGVSPSMIIGKIRSTTGDWYVWQTAMGDNFVKLNTTAAQLASTANGVYNTASFSSTVFALGSGSTMNASGGTFVAYCFAQVAGYSAFGSYTGNGSSDGAFVYLGFRARYVMIKCSSSTGGWVLLDTSRDPYNDVDNYLYANSSAADAGSSNVLDINSNGFKIRNSWTDINGSGTTYIYMAFAESPFKFSLAR